MASNEIVRLSSVDLTDQADSIACDNASNPVDAVIAGGRASVNAGSRIAISGRIEPSAIDCFTPSLYMTAK
jgi:hypothetical protein